MDGTELLVTDSLLGMFRRKAKSRQGDKRRQRPKGLWPLLVCVMLPTTVSAAYFLGFASPQYESEANFVVRGQSAAPSGMLTSLLLSAGGGSTSEDTYAVQDYMMSRDAAALLIKTQDLRIIYNRPEADVIAHFPNFHQGVTFESFYKYYQKHVTAELDTTTNISTLKVKTFRPTDSQKIAEALLVASEQLINRMNIRQRDNLMSSASREVAEAEGRLRNIGKAMADYRNKMALLDPMKQSVSMLRDISDLQMMLTTTLIQVSQLKSSAPTSPLIPVYERRVTALRAQIALSNTGITGSTGSLVPKITAYDDLTLQNEFAEKQLANATVSLEAAKAQADRQQIYLEEITQPNSPDYAAFPKRWASIAVVFFSFLGLYLMARLVINGAREHQIV